jgi:hypothetical protein
MSRQKEVPELDKGKPPVQNRTGSDEERPVKSYIGKRNIELARCISLSEQLDMGVLKGQLAMAVSVDRRPSSLERVSGLEHCSLEEPVRHCSCY